MKNHKVKFLPASLSFTLSAQSRRTLPHIHHIAGEVLKRMYAFAVFRHVVLGERMELVPAHAAHNIYRRTENKTIKRLRFLGEVIHRVVLEYAAFHFRALAARVRESGYIR